MMSKKSLNNIIDPRPTEITFDDFILKTKFKFSEMELLEYIFSKSKVVE